MGDRSADAGRDLPDVNKQEFMKECYRKEDHTRLRSYVKNAKYRERQKSGDFKMLTVMRDRILGGVPKPGGYYKRVYIDVPVRLNLGRTREIGKILSIDVYMVNYAKLY